VIRLAVLALAVALTAAPAAAMDIQVFDLDTKAPVMAGKTWAELLRQVFPDLRQETEKDGTIGYAVGEQNNLRPIHKDTWNDACPEPSPKIDHIEYADVEISGHPRVIVGVTTEADACFGALALFDATGEAKLLDVANIQQDMHYAYGPDFARRLGADGQLVVTGSFHLNSDGAFDDELLVLANADKFSLIGDIEADSEWDCEHHRRISEDPYVMITPDYGALDRITGYVKHAVQPVGEDCRAPAGNPKVTITRTDWRWDAARKAYRKVTP
jgi:hypothetical protein